MKHVLTARERVDLNSKKEIQKLGSKHEQERKIRLI